MEAKELKACPFCGSTDISVEDVRCWECGATAEDVEGWNRRGQSVLTAASPSSPRGREEAALRRDLIHLIDQWDGESEYDAEDVAALADDVLNLLDRHPAPTLGSGEAVAWQFQDSAGRWSETQDPKFWTSRGAPVRALFTSPASPEIEGLREALEPFAQAADHLTDRNTTDDQPVEFALYPHEQPKVGDLRRAIAALSASPVRGEG